MSSVVLHEIDNVRKRLITKLEKDLKLYPRPYAYCCLVNDVIEPHMRCLLCK